MQYIKHYNSPLGDLLMTANEQGLTGLWLEVFIAQYNYQKLQSEMENIASPKWRKLQRIF